MPKGARKKLTKQRIAWLAWRAKRKLVALTPEQAARRKAHLEAVHRLLDDQMRDLRYRTKTYR